MDQIFLYIGFKIGFSGGSDSLPLGMDSRDPRGNQGWRAGSSIVITIILISIVDQALVEQCNRQAGNIQELSALLHEEKSHLARAAIR